MFWSDGNCTDEVQEGKRSTIMPKTLWWAQKVKFCPGVTRQKPKTTLRSYRIQWKEGVLLCWWEVEEDGVVHDIPSQNMDCCFLLSASFLGVSSVENGKRDCTSHHGVSRNGPWERLPWTRRTLGRVDEKNETPRRFGLISLQRTPISEFGLWTVPVALF